MKDLIVCVFAGIVFSGCGGVSNSDWSYEDKSFEKFGSCKSGKMQSPINLEIKESVYEHKAEFDYKLSKLNERNDGKTIRFAYDSGSFLKIDDKQYELIEFHFHSPSEHTINNYQFPIEFQFEHKDKDDNLVIVGAMVKEGDENKNFEKIIKNLLYQKDAALVKKDIEIDLFSILPNPNRFFYYEGSMTTPPCKEGVKWIFLQGAIELSKEQIEAFQKAYINNNRPIQPINDRDIFVK